MPPDPGRGRRFPVNHRVVSLASRRTRLMAPDSPDEDRRRSGALGIGWLLIIQGRVVLQPRERKEVT
jgi:hypothetical protein